MPIGVIDALTAAQLASVHLGRNIHPATLRQWVHRGHIRRASPKGYDLGELYAYLDSRKEVATP